MKMKSLILIFIALGCGLVATIGISQVMERGGAGGGPAIKMDQILVAKGDIDIGAALNANSVQLEDWPATKIPEGATRSLDEVKGKFPQARFYKGEPILLPKIADKNGNSSDKIPEGYRTATIKVDEDTVMEGIGPGDRVDVMVFLRKGEGIAQTGVYPIIKNVRVFSKGAQTERVVDSKTNQETRSRTISLLVKLAQAQEIALASQMGKISLALRNPKDDPSDDKEDAVPLSVLLNGKASSGDDKKGQANTGSDSMLDELRNAVPKQPGPAQPAAAPAVGGFVMTLQTPNEIKSYQWAGDHNALPLETVLLSMGTGTSGTSPTPVSLDGSSGAPPVKVENNDQGTGTGSGDGR